LHAPLSCKKQGKQREGERKRVQESTHGSQRNGQIKRREKESESAIVGERYLSCCASREFSNPEQVVRD
jgi:hypothetical protein